MTPDTEAPSRFIHLRMTTSRDRDREMQGKEVERGDPQEYIAVANTTHRMGMHQCSDEIGKIGND